MKETTVLQRMATYVHDMRLEQIPEDVLRHAKVCIMDALECCISSESDARKAGALASIEKGDGLPCTLYGTKQRAGLADAAFYNTVSGAISYRNDISIAGKGHPGSVVIPTVLAVAQRYRLSGERTLMGIIAGYETMIRMGAMLGHANFPFTFRPTGFTGPVGAAFAAAKAEELSVDAIVSAASFAFNCASGLNEWATAGTGEDVIQNGWAARNGVLCAALAKSGVSGAPSVIEGRHGFLNAYDLQPWIGDLTDSLGETYYLLDTKFKQLPACMNVQNAAQIAQSISKMDGFSAADIASVRIDATQGGKDWPNGDNTNVKTLIQAAMSIPFTVAQTLLTGDCDHIKWAPPYSPEVTDLMKRCAVVAKPEYTAIQQAHQVIGITVILKNGKTFFQEQLDAATLTEAQAVEKFRQTAASLYGKAQSEELCSLLTHLEELDDVLPVLSILA